MYTIMWYWISYDSFCLLTEILEAILSFLCDISAAKCNEYQRTVGYPSTCWASCSFMVKINAVCLSAENLAKFLIRLCTTGIY